MSSLNGASVRSLLKKGVVHHVTTDTPVAIRVRHTGNCAVTSVTVTSATGVILIDADGTTTIVWSTDATVGAVADAINAAANWECRVLDALRQDASDNVFLAGAITAAAHEGVLYYNMYNDTSVSLELTARLSADRHTASANIPGGNHRVHLMEYKYFGQVGTAAMDNEQVFEVNGVNENQKIKALNVDNSATTRNWASGHGYITATEGRELVVRIKDAATFTDATTNYITVLGFVE